jgi:hypothetical protein
MAETQNAEQDLLWIGLLALIVLVYKYQNEIMDFLNAFFIVVGSITLLGACGVIGWRVWQWRSTRHERTADQPEADVEPLLLEYHPAKKEKTHATEKADCNNDSEVPSPLKKSLKECDEVWLLNRKLYHIKELSRKEQEWLKFNHYHLREFVPLGKTRREQYLIKEGKNDMLDHTFLMHHIAKLLEGRVEDIETHRHTLPTITFTRKGEKCAIEVVTDRPVDRKENRLYWKKERNNRAYGIHWWFVISRSAYAKFFHPYGFVITRHKFMDWLDEEFPPFFPSY